MIMYHWLQLSWTEDHKTTKLGKRTISFYDEEGATSIRKVCQLIAYTSFFIYYPVRKG